MPLLLPSCNAGRYTNSTGTAECTLCPAGTFLEDEATDVDLHNSVSDCSACGTGACARAPNALLNKVLLMKGFVVTLPRDFHVKPHTWSLSCCWYAPLHAETQDCTAARTALRARRALRDSLSTTQGALVRSYAGAGSAQPHITRRKCPPASQMVFPFDAHTQTARRDDTHLLPWLENAWSARSASTQRRRGRRSASCAVPGRTQPTCPAWRAPSVSPDAPNQPLARLCASIVRLESTRAPQGRGSVTCAPLWAKASHPRKAPSSATCASQGTTGVTAPRRASSVRPTPCASEAPTFRNLAPVTGWTDRAWTS